MVVSRRSGSTRPDPFAEFVPASTRGSLGMRDRADPNVRSDPGDTPGALGKNDGAEQLAKFYGPGSRSKSRFRRRRARRRRTASNRELNLWADFKPGPWNTPQEIVAEINTGKDNWFPGKDELLEFAKSGKRKNAAVVGVRNMWNVLGAIGRIGPKRINLFTHARSGYIAFSGEVLKGDVSFNTDEKDTDFSSQSIERAKMATFQEHDKAKRMTIVDVRRALPRGAKMVIYACHAGLDTDYLKKIAKLLRIRVESFSKEIRYHPVRIVGGRIIWQYSAGAGKKVYDFHNLKPDKSVPP
jgi:hypothetical protein